MEPVTLLLSGVLFITFLLLLLPVNKRKSKIATQINHLPGPPCYPFVGTALPLILCKRNELFNHLVESNNKYSPMFRSWNGSLPQVHLHRPEDVEVILKSSEHLDKGEFYRFLHRWLGTGLLTATGQKWHTHRKLITPTFHFKILDNFLEVFSEKSEILISKLQKEVGEQGFDIYPYITKCTLDIICETAMGTPIYAQDDRGSDYVKAVYDMSEVSVKRMFRPWLHSDFFFKLSAIGKRHDECLRVLHGFTNKVIRERKAQVDEKTNENTSTSTDEDMIIGKKRKMAFLDLLLEASLDGVRLTDVELREEVDTFMFEGHDTTSSGIGWALFLMGLYPEVQEKAYEEQEQIFEASHRSPTMKDLGEMKYLERVIKESLRLYPSVPLIARKIHTDVAIGGHNIPSGCSILMHIYHVHRNPEQFPNPEEFNPDNFLPERVANRHPYAYIPFSAGPRNCIGQKFALLEEKTVLSYILRYCKIRSLENREDINIFQELVLRPARGIKVTIKPRRPIRGL